MIQNTKQAKAGGVPRLAMINSFASFGRISTTVALPVISAMKVQVCPVPTSILSNHLDFPACYYNDYTPHMKDHIHVWEELNLTFDGLYCGFLGSVEQIEIIMDFLKSPMLQSTSADRPIFLLDPVMGDNGKKYSTITPEHCAKMKALSSLADILTPNITEACILTDTPYKESGWSASELADICRSLSERHPIPGHQRVVITGLLEQDRFLNYVWENEKATVCYTPVTGASRHGTGDLFASILAADALKGVPLAQSVQKAADFVALCIRGSQEAGIPMREGVIFEKYLSRLCE